MHVHSLPVSNTVVSGTMYVNTLAKDMLAKTLSSESQLGNKNIFTCASSISDLPTQSHQDPGVISTVEGLNS